MTGRNDTEIEWLLLQERYHLNKDFEGHWQGDRIYFNFAIGIEMSVIFDSDPDPDSETDGFSNRIRDIPCGPASCLSMQLCRPGPAGQGLSGL